MQISDQVYESVRTMCMHENRPGEDLEYYLKGYYSADQLCGLCIQDKTGENVDSFDSNNSATWDIVFNSVFAYSLKMQQFIFLRGNNNSFALLNEEMWKGDQSKNSEAVKNFIAVMTCNKKGKANGFADFKRSGVYKLYIPAEQIKSIFGDVEAVISHPDDIQRIGHELLTGNAQSSDFEITFQG
jgi:hypothetical protein